jgi:hypothetical protein
VIYQIKTQQTHQFNFLAQASYKYGKMCANKGKAFVQLSKKLDEDLIHLQLKLRAEMRKRRIADSVGVVGE